MLDKCNTIQLQYKMYTKVIQILDLKGGEKSVSKVITIRIEDKTSKKIDNFCDKNEIKQSKLIKNLIDNFFRLQEELYD